MIYITFHIKQKLAIYHVAHYENPLKFSGKEFDEITGLYDHGARNRNPISTLWYGIDPLWEKYPDFSPYNYCAENPVRLVDLDGRETIFFFNLHNPDNLPIYYHGGSHNEEGVISVYCHAIKDKFYVLDKYVMNPMEFMNSVENQSEVWKMNQKDNKQSIVFLRACESGDGLGSSAQQLSDIYKNDIFVAPNAKVLYKSDIDTYEESMSFDNAYKIQSLQTKETVENKSDGSAGVWNVFKGGAIIGEIPGNTEPTKEMVNEVIKEYEKNNN